MKRTDPHSILKGEDGYLLLVVSVIGVIMAFLFAYVLPQLHIGQMVRGMTILNEERALEAARRGVQAVRLGSEACDNVQDLIGYPVSGVTAGNTFEVNGSYAYLFYPGAKLTVCYSNDNDGSYTVSGSSEYVISGVTLTGVNVDQALSGNTLGMISRDRGILHVVNNLTGTSGTATEHDEYRDANGNVQFVSGCRGIDLGGEDAARLDVLVLVARNGSIDVTANGNPRDDGWYLYRSGVTGPNGVPWLSVDNWPFGTTTSFEYLEGAVHYYDLDMKETLNSSNYGTNADVKVQIIDGTCYVAIGSNGTWRGKTGGTELWNFSKGFLSGTTPFYGKDNDADGDIDRNDGVGVFVFVRSRGITASPGDNYETNKNDLKLVHDVNSGLPNPAPQILEAGFYLERP